MAELTKMAIALPRELHAWVRSEAEREERSLNTIVVRLIRDRMQQQREHGRKAGNTAINT